MTDGLSHVSTVLWFIGFGLMGLSFVFLFGRSEEPKLPRITVEPWWPGSEDEHK